MDRCGTQGRLGSKIGSHGVRARVFLLSVGAAGLALFAGFGIAMAACEHSVRDVFSGFGNIGTFENVQPIPIPQTACPYVRLASRRRRGCGNTVARRVQAVPRLGAVFDAALGAARESRRRARRGGCPTSLSRWRGTCARFLADVKVGRVQLLAATSRERLHGPIRRSRGLRRPRPRERAHRHRVRPDTGAATAVLMQPAEGRNPIAARLHDVLTERLTLLPAHHR